jgi:hypothetical protein
MSLVCTLSGSMARADAMTGYTLTDLGSPYLNNHTANAAGYAISNTGANGTLSAPNGNTYAFQSTNNLVTNSQAITSTFQPFITPAIPYYYKHFDNSNDTRAFLNQAGVFVGTAVTGMAGNDDLYASSTVYAATRQANGSFGPLSALWSTGNNLTSSLGSPQSYSAYPIANVLSLNNTGQMLGVANIPGDFALYNLKTGVLTNLASLVPDPSVGIASAIAIDDQGRILIDSYQPNSPNSPKQPDSNGSNFHDELYLLTPDGLSSAPLATPEPSTLVTLAVAGIGLMVRRRWKSR